jgi:hypothetical protein
MNNTSIFWTPKRTEIDEYSNRLSKNETKSAFQKMRRKQLKLFRLKCNTDCQLLQPINNQRPKKFKEPINKSEDKVRSYNNKVNKYRSSEMEDTR